MEEYGVSLTGIRNPSSHVSFLDASHFLTLLCFALCFPLLTLSLHLSCLCFSDVLLLYLMKALIYTPVLDITSMNSAKIFNVFFYTHTYIFPLIAQIPAETSLASVIKKYGQTFFVEGLPHSVQECGD